MSDEQHPFASESMKYGFRQTNVGLTVIAISRRGVAAVLLGSDRGVLVQKLAEALAAAELSVGDASIGPMLDAVERQINDPARQVGLDLDLRGSGGELAVWTALRAIPAGETRSYGALAKAIDAGLTAQDVGAACAANRLAVVVPCHRVLKADGSISGYRWGVHRKRKLLAMEQAA